MSRAGLTEYVDEQDAEAILKEASSAGYYVRLGAQFVIEDVEYPVPWEMVHRIRREFDPAFVPLFCREGWRAPNGDIFVTGRFMCGRYVPLPHEGQEPLNILWPSHKVGGVWWHGPVIESATFETDRADDEVEKKTHGVARKDIGGFVPFDGRVYRTLAAIAEQNRNRRTKDILADVIDKQIAEPKRKQKAVTDELRLELRDKWKWLSWLREQEQTAAGRRALGAH